MYQETDSVLLRVPYMRLVVLFLSSFFLEKNEAKKSSLFSNRFAFKGVHNDKAHLRVINKKYDKSHNIYIDIFAVVYCRFGGVAKECTSVHD